jgi:hypothetical protein
LAEAAVAMKMFDLHSSARERFMRGQLSPNNSRVRLAVRLNVARPKFTAQPNERTRQQRRAIWRAMPIRPRKGEQRRPATWREIPA